jgi:hypothetical protein
MTPNHDHNTLFQAPPAPQADADAAGRPEPDSRTEAMQGLRHPFAVPPAPPLAATDR